jgi:hypothetical protein
MRSTFTSVNRLQFMVEGVGYPALILRCVRGAIFVGGRNDLRFWERWVLAPR